MLSEAPHTELLEHLRRLERELHSLRQSLSPKAGLPTHDFTALMVDAGGASYAFDVAQVSEVVPVVWPEPLPETPAWVRGSIAYGNTAVPIIDMGARLGNPISPLALEQRIVLAQTPRLTGFLVDGLGGLMPVSAASLIPPPEGIPQAPFILAAVQTPNHGIVNILSLERLSRDFLG